MDPSFARQDVSYATREPPGTIVIDPSSHFLYLVQGGGKAVRYGVGVGAEGFVWSGRATVHSKQEWPDWYPTAEMLERKPEIRPHMVQLQSGLGMKGGPENPHRRARAVPLEWQQGHALPHPRHQRAVDHRHKRVLRLHPPDQRGYCRSLQPRAGGHQSRCAQHRLDRHASLPRKLFGSLIRHP